MSLFVSGETASGKTTLLNAITTFIPPENKIITIEDTPELTVPHRNWIREVALAKGKGEGDGAGGGGDHVRSPQGRPAPAPQPDPCR